MALKPLTRLALPAAVLAVGITFACYGAFANPWVVTLYAVLSVPLVVLWSRRTTAHRPLTSLNHLMDTHARCRWTITSIFAVAMMTWLLTVVSAIACLLFIPATRSLTGYTVAVMAIAWTRFVWLPFFQVISYAVLLHVSRSLDLQQTPQPPASSA